MFCVIQPRHCISTIVPASPDLRRSFIVEKKSSNFASKLTKIAFFTSAGTALIGVDRNPIQNPQFFGSGETLHLYGNATLVQNASVNFFLMARSWNHPRCLPAASRCLAWDHFQSQIPRFVRPGSRMKAAPHAANVVIRKVRSYRMISGTYVAFRGVVICPDLHIFVKKIDISNTDWCYETLVRSAENKLPCNYSHYIGSRVLDSNK